MLQDTRFFLLRKQNLSLSNIQGVITYCYGFSFFKKYILLCLIVYYLYCINYKFQKMKLNLKIYKIFIN
jgi:hypothetical protein